MPAGRELDARVAEKVMDLRQPDDFGTTERHQWARDDESEYGTYYCKRCFAQSQAWANEADLVAGPCDHEPPPYSTNMTFAWPVVERLRERGFDVDVTARPGWQYGCRVAPKGAFNTPAVKFEAADSAPMAICLAALRAVGAVV